MKMNRIFLLLAAPCSLATPRQWRATSGRPRRPTPGTPNSPGWSAPTITPANAINQLEMWQPETFDPATIDQGARLCAVDRHEHDARVPARSALGAMIPRGLKKRMDVFLTIAAKHKIKPLFVLFDSCWDPEPKSPGRSIRRSPASIIRAGCSLRALPGLKRRKPVSASSRPM
jgi:hypothetical protein